MKKLKKRSFCHHAKRIIVPVATILTILLMVFACSCASNGDSSGTTAYTPYSSETCKGKQYAQVKDDFISVGFTNISEEAIFDLKASDADKAGLVEAVSINGIDTFDGNQEFSNSSRIIVKFHSYVKVNSPVSYDNVKSMEAEELIRLFSEAGFVNISTEEIDDLDPDVAVDEFENTVKIDDKTVFYNTDAFSIDSSIIITTHRTYQKHTLKIVVDFISNLFFNKYDVILDVNGAKETLTHGEDKEIEYRLQEGSYTISFTSAESPTVKGTADIILTGDTEASYQINCHSDNISVDLVYLENKAEVGDNQAIIPCSASNCKYKNCNDIEKAFTDAGFTNISMEILYDIFWGWTKEGEVERVTVNGDSNFKRGDIFDKNEQIVIVYHMREEDDPSRQVETSSTTETSNPIIPDIKREPEPVFYSTNTEKTVNDGNSGVYAYRDSGNKYYNYWIIDFDEGYVYSFTNGLGSGSCDKVKIVSGELNSVLIITYHDGGSSWSYGLHFNRAGQPNCLILQEEDGDEYIYSPTNLNDALELRDKLEIIEY